MNYPNYSTNPLYAPIPLWAFIIGVIGVVVLLVSFLYGAINIYKTKDTSQISLLMWIIVLVGTISLDIFFILGIILTNGSSLSFILMFALELITIIISSYIMVIKIINQQKAKKKQITEKEYCQLKYQAYLKKKNKGGE